MPAGSAYVESMPPQVPAGCRVLVLGSMPGTRSLGQQQYYAHPLNLFWPFMEALTGVPAALDYAERLARLNAAGVGLWDVLRACERPGSLDSAVARHSEVPNDLARLLRERPTIRALAFNGGLAWQAFRRHVLAGLPQALSREIPQLHPLPSTSPAHASVSRAEKLAQWRVLQPYLE
ncbi:DNA-deoxyinosine glycosylase [Tahibacter amnicola]|uniref:DNA-deoxyinosine glycosylase n=1 Tax=Tahibacter amnicola TaxID=2976241 RepID=A0ABY6BIY9_9GAMM|nr:DNA-deoxyinosine glycosylase [Tahibacter amnicola]UXI69065.1 DNA-deoxyinosine glycosylase [Tahibacter amnicola]